MKAIRCAAVVLTVLVVCPWTPAEDEPAKVDVRGTIARVTPAAKNTAGVLGTVRVEGVKDKTTNYDKASVRITEKTKIEKVVGKKREAATFADLKEKVRVEALFT